MYHPYLSINLNICSIIQKGMVKYFLPFAVMGILPSCGIMGEFFFLALYVTKSQVEEQLKASRYLLCVCPNHQ